MIDTCETLVDVVRARAAARPDDLWLRYLVSGDVTGPVVELTYGELERRARAIAATLQRCGRAGDRALLLYPSGLDFVTAFFGCLFAGMIPVPAYPPDPSRAQRTLAKLHAIADDCGAALALTTSEFLPMLAQVRPAGAVCLATDTCVDVAGWQAPALSAESIALLQYTSGSTGAPKGVVLQHRHLLANERSIAAGMGPVELVVGWLPIFHDMGLIGNVLQGLCAGSGLVLMSPVAFLKRPARWLEAISHYRATTSGGPNFAYDLCVRRVSDEERGRLDLSSWKVAYCGAEPVRDATYRRFLARFEQRGLSPATFYPCYGLAEATLFVTGHRRGTPPRSVGFDAAALERGEIVVSTDPARARVLMSCGTPSPTEEVRIVDPERHGPTEGVGEIWVRGPGVASGYWERDADDVFRACLAGGDGPFLRTGDLGFLHGGELYLAGRRKDLIILAGRNLFPQDLEAAIEAAVPAVRPGCCAAFSIEDEGEERLCIMAETDSATTPVEHLVRDIKGAVAAACGVATYDVLIVGKGALPKTSSGKLERYACRLDYRRERACRPASE
ncbi:MAG: fatty acyl-AMP ligase [Kofleriaceae bacterium]|nr:fatty acyl-AMP ligase [Kofleriaceae bacterium]MBP9206232.1 fatty acyl-AMP ligase [Kofleriaceae bacterium]